MKRLTILLLAMLPLLSAACAGSAPVPGPKAITLEALDIAYGNVALKVVVGQPVRLIFKNAGELEHDFNIEKIAVTRINEQSTAHGHGSGADVDLHLAAAPGGTATLEFTPLEAGTYEFFCSTAGHKQAGMIGTLIVKES